MPLDSRIAATSTALTSLRLCDARLQNDARFPWLILIPRVPDARDLDELSPAQRALLIEEVAWASTVLRDACAALGRRCEKLNVAALGNVVPQLHVHIVARHPGDAAWPNPVWGQGAPEPYDDETRRRFCAALRSRLCV